MHKVSAIVVEDTNVDRQYGIRIIGRSSSGNKAVIDIAGVKPYVYAVVSEHTMSIDEVVKTVVGTYCKYETSVVYGKPFIGYRKTDLAAYKVSFDTSYDRKRFIEQCTPDLAVLYHNSVRGKYAAVVSRDYRIPFPSWITGMTFHSEEDGIEYYSADINDLQATDHVGDTIVACFDIETYDSSGALPWIDSPTARIMCISLTLHKSSSTEPLKSFLWSQYPCDLDGVKTKKRAMSEEEVVRRFLCALAKYKPDFLTGFNIFKYDIPWIQHCVKKYGLEGILESMSLLTRPPMDYFTKPQLKVDATQQDTECTIFTPTLFITVDARHSFRLLYPTHAHSSLKYYLGLMGLDPKDDITHVQMHEEFGKYVHDPANADQEMLDKISKYCVVDSIRSFELLYHRNVIADAREICSMSYVLPVSGFYNAGGMKITSLVFSRCESNGKIFFVDETPRETPENSEKYDGAMVFEPNTKPNVPKPSFDELLNKKGSFVTSDNITKLKAAYPDVPSCLTPDQLLKFKEWQDSYNGRPVAGLDFSSLYPSIMRAYNLSPERFIPLTKPANVPKLAKKFEVDEWCIYPVSITVGSEAKFGAFVRYTPENKESEFGIFGRLLDELVIMRNKYKKLLAETNDLLETETDPEKKRSLLVQKSNYNSKQNAVKVLMNTMYGEAGNTRSPINIVQLAAGVTSTGVRTITGVADYVRANGWTLQYGDTDSVYISLVDSNFQELDTEYFRGNLTKVEYASRQVEMTIERANQIKEKINAYLFEETRGHYMSMAYEEVLFPVHMQAKKRYFGIPHVSKADFGHGLFIRGFEVVKRNANDAMKSIQTSLLKTLGSLENCKSPYELVVEKIREIYSMQWNLKDFAITKVFKAPKPGKPGNAELNTLVARLRERGELIKYGDVFNVVVIKNDNKNASVGDKDELLEYAQEHELELDLDHYIEKNLTKQFSKFISYMYEDPNSEDRIKDADKIALKEIRNICKLYGSVAPKTTIATNKTIELLCRFSKTILGLFAGTIVDNFMSFQGNARQYVSAHICPEFKDNKALNDIIDQEYNKYMRFKSAKINYRDKEHLWQFEKDYRHVRQEAVAVQRRMIDTIAKLAKAKKPIPEIVLLMQDKHKDDIADIRKHVHDLFDRACKHSIGIYVETCIETMLAVGVSRDVPSVTTEKIADLMFEKLTRKK